MARDPFFLSTFIRSLERTEPFKEGLNKMGFKPKPILMHLLDYINYRKSSF